MRSFLLLSLLAIGCQFSVPHQAPDCKPDCHVIDAHEFRVLIVENTAERSKLPSKQLMSLTSKAVKDYLREHCVKGPDGKTPQFKIVDETATLTGSWKEMADSSPRKSLPWLYATNGSAGVSMPLPEVDKMVDVLKKYAEPK